MGYRYYCRECGVRFGDPLEYIKVSYGKLCVDCRRTTRMQYQTITCVYTGTQKIPYEADKNTYEMTILQKPSWFERFLGKRAKRTQVIVTTQGENNSIRNVVFKEAPHYSPHSSTQKAIEQLFHEYMTNLQWEPVDIELPEARLLPRKSV